MWGFVFVWFMCSLGSGRWEYIEGVYKGFIYKWFISVYKCYLLVGIMLLCYNIVML